jgi:hypothetical protein
MIGARETREKHEKEKIFKKTFTAEGAESAERKAGSWEVKRFGS